MFSSTLFKKIFLYIFCAMAFLFVCIYFQTVPVVKNKVFSLERESAMTILDNVYEIVDAKYQDIEGYRKSALEDHKRELRNIVQIAESHIRNRYTDYTSGRLTETRAKEMVLQELRSFLYGKNDYIWVADYQSVLISHPDKELFNADFSEVTDIHGNLIVPDLVKVALDHGEGFHSYWWRRLGSTTPMEKLSYSKHFKPWEWVVGTGVYINDVEEEVDRQKTKMIEDLKQILTTIRIAGTGYMFIFDSDMTMLIHPDPKLEGTFGGNLLNPDTGKPILKDLVAVAGERGRDYVYRWNKPGDKDNFIHEKMSWVREFKGLGWYIASSVYVDELNKGSMLLRNRILFIFLITFFLFFLVSCFFLNRLLVPVRKLYGTAEEVMAGNLSVRCNIDTKDEFGMLADAFNSMVAKLSSNIRELDSRVRERTAELLKAKDLAESAAKAKSTFLANMSHEIKTPLNAIMGLTQLTCETDLTEKQNGYVDKIGKSAQSLSLIVHDILDFSKIEAGKMEVIRSEFSMEDMLDHLSEMFALKAQKKGLTLDYKVSDQVPGLLFGDSVHLTQVLMNLISNGIKYTDKGGVTVTVDTVEAGEQVEDPSCVTLTVSVMDSGIGISGDDIGRLFQPFTQIDESITRTHGGTGLGLSICKQLIGLMGGNIGVESRPNIGSTFVFTSVFERVSGVTSPARLYEEQNLKRGSGHVPDINPISGVHILLVEDNEINRQVVREYLENRSIRVTVAENGREAVDCVVGSEVPFHAILMDIQMPVMNGLDAAKAILSIEKGAWVPIIALTAHALVEEREKCLDLGMVDYLTKPINPQAILNTLVTWIKPGHTPPIHDMAIPDNHDFIGRLPTSVPGIDIADGLARVDHDEELYLELLGKLKDTYTHAARDIRHHITGQDMKRVYHVVHSLKGVAGNLGAHELSNSAQAIQEVLNEGGDISHLLGTFEEALSRVMASIEELEQLRPETSVETPL
ncbi:MAG: cache domain-containing protein [Proteobacteria bacterium]|nr:cache domain-containing protein [Pseudomonadota bacterium]